MGIMKRWTVALVAAAVVGAPQIVSAQLLTFYTQGYFTGSGSCTNSSAATNNCTFGGYTLSFSGSGSASTPNGPYVTQPSAANIPLGAFTMAGTGSLASIAGNSFTLDIFQMTPGTGTGSFAGALTGNFSFNPTNNDLVWVPSPNSLVINSLPDFATTYTLVNTTAPGQPLGIRINDQTTSITGTASVAPEPATLVLLATGMGLVGLVGYRRRQQFTA
jgi:hypothetical protein